MTLPASETSMSTGVEPTGSVSKLVSFANAYGTGLIVYTLVACISAAAEWGSFAVALAHMPPIGAALVGFVTATGVNFVLSRHFVFRSRSWWVSELARLVLSSAAVFVCNLAVFYACYAFLAAPLMTAKIAGTTAGFVLNFAARQFWIFSPQPRHAPVSRQFGER
jgi:putative flippase GtrA